MGGADSLVIGGREFWNQDDSEDSERRRRGLGVGSRDKGGKKGVSSRYFVNGT